MSSQVQKYQITLLHQVGESNLFFDSNSNVNTDILVLALINEMYLLGRECLQIVFYVYGLLGKSNPELMGDFLKSMYQNSLNYKSS